MTDWQFALCQHPMYMIIEHDETAAERTPPWGEPDISTYIERIRRNLSALDRYPHLKFNYDFSGAELEGLAERAPDLIARLRHFVQAGRVGFVNGSYAQAHLQGLGGESNLRQLTEGLAAIERIAGVRVRSYAHQEPAIHDQMPQLLRALGYDFAVTPGFFWALSFLTPHEILGVQYQGLRFLQDEEFTAWRGLDGTEIPLYLTQPRIRPKGGVHGTDSHQQALRNEWVKGLQHYPPIRCDFPDMVDIDYEWVADHANQEFVILQRALERRLTQTPVRSAARLYTYWAYGEGIEAELLHRTDRTAEAALLEAESLSALAQALAGRAANDLREPWRKLLRAQHHDAYWVAGVGLRACAVNWAKEAQSAAETEIEAATAAIAAQVDTRGDENRIPLIAWEPWPVSRTDIATVEVHVPASGVENLTTRDAAGAALPTQVISSEPEENGTRIRAQVLVHTDGLGYQALSAEPGPRAATVQGSLHFQNRFYRAAVQADGTFDSLQTAGGVELIPRGTRGGNQLGATTPEGAPLEFRAEGTPGIVAGAVGQVITVRGSIGDARLAQEIWFYHDLPRIDLVLAFDFDNALFGNYWQDESKLNVFWPVSPRGHIDHDIPFGVTAGRAERSFFPTRWVRVGSAGAGLALFHRGTNRFWVRDNVLANVLGCGVMGRDIGTRAMPYPYIKDYDLRLRGHHEIRYAVYPHDGDWAAADLPARAFAYSYPLRLRPEPAHAGSLPASLSFLRLESEGLLPSAVLAEGSDVVCRMFETRGGAVFPAWRTLAPWRAQDQRTLAGEPVGRVKPFEIVQLVLRK